MSRRMPPLFALLALNAATSAVAQSSVGLRLDCLHGFNTDKGASQECITLTGLRFEARETLPPALSGRIRLDPFGTPVASKENTPLRDGLPSVRDTPFLLVDDYALIWTPRPNLEVGIESYGGAAKIPSQSGLALASRFADTGWKQTALTVGYHLTALSDMRVKLAAGNGEGESGQNLDPQQFFGFGVDADVIAGLALVFGASFDGNSAGSDAATYQREQLAADCGVVSPAPKLGHSTQRLAAGLRLDGTMKGFEGLSVGLGWQRNVFSDLDKKKASTPPLTDYAKCPQLDLDTFFVEDPKGEAVNTVQRTTYGVSARYRLLERYFVGGDFTSRRIDTGSVDTFSLCNAYQNSVCVTPESSGKNQLEQTAYTLGGGMDLEAGLVLTIEYHKTSFDKRYAQAFFRDRRGKTSDSDETFDARIAYNWK